MSKILKLTYLNLNTLKQLESQILLCHCVLPNFRSSGIYYLQFLDKQIKRYDFCKFREFSVLFLNRFLFNPRGWPRGMMPFADTASAGLVFWAIGFKWKWTI
jgi:hypothetical protein